MNRARVRRAGKVVCVAAVLVLGTFEIWNICRSSVSLPIYQGKNLDEWFFGQTGHPGVEPTFTAANEAFRAMGSADSVPYLLEKLRGRETSLNRFHCWIYPKCPAVLRSKLTLPVTAAYDRQIALSHLRRVTRTMRSVPPGMMEIVPEIRDGATRLALLGLVATLATRWIIKEEIAHRPVDVEREIQFFLRFLDDVDFRIQLKSAVALATLDDSLSNGIPILLNAVTNTSLMNANFPTWRLPGVHSPQEQSALQQSIAHKALRKVAPDFEESLLSGSRELTY